MGYHRGSRDRPSWYYGICDRKITKFVTEKYLQEEPDRKKSADECVASVRSRIQAYTLDCLWNADQSGFEYEMRPGRTLDLVGAKHVLALTRSMNSMTHSYTVMMCVSPDSWPTFADQEAVEEVKPEELEYEIITIPPKVTGQIQPLDVLCFRMYKGYFRKVSNWIFLNDQLVQVHHRDVILKLHSLIYQQFISRRFENLIA
ncbi:hypothetical protein RvY_13182 [Ramazzottius varieornatus]|uniref:Uncharacterized protein n=1 Tax=Ramazzottius varieornatus TaxID=947166 RepID=A0A1D1VR28_RAMVA|nr:hypothetical protein RvY_13182 [Ramazzottius varieornatus]